MKVIEYLIKHTGPIDIWTFRLYTSPISGNGACFTFWKEVNISNRFMGLILLFKQAENKGYLSIHPMDYGGQVYFIVFTFNIKTAIVKTIN